MLVLAAHDLAALLRVADITAAMSVEALLGTDRAFDADLVALRPQPGQQLSARNLRALLAGSAIVASHRHGDDRVQDAYSLRCAPQVTGAARDVLAHAERRRRRRAAQRDRQPDGAARRARRVVRQLPRRAAGVRVRRAGDRDRRGRRDRRAAHRPAARRVALVSGLPPFLAPDAGVNSGLMIAQYTQAAMVAENRRLAAPASVGSLPTSAMQEDHVSMGWAAARKLRTVVDNLARILAVELVCAARGIELRDAAAAGAGHGRRAGRRARGGDRRRRAGPLARARARRRRAARARRRAAATRSRTRSASWHERRRAPRPRPARQRDLLSRLAAGGGAADAAQQPRPGGRRAPRRPRRLRRHRPRRALVGGLRRDRPHAAHARAATRRCSCSPASRSASSARTSGRRACCSRTPTSCPSGRRGTSFAASRSSA